MGKVLSPIFGSLLALIVWYAVYFAFPVLVIPAVIALWIFVKEPQRTEAIPPIAQYKNHLVKIWKRQGKWMIVAFLAGAVTLFILFGVLFYLSDILEAKYRIDGILKGLILAIPLLAMSSTSYWTGGHIRQKTRRMRLFIAGGLFSISLAMAVIPFFSNTYVLLGLLVLIGIGSGLVLPSLNTLITSAVGSDERGIVTSLYGSVRFLGVAIGPPVFGLGKPTAAAFPGSQHRSRPHGRPCLENHPANGPSPGKRRTESAFSSAKRDCNPPDPLWAPAARFGIT